MNKKIMTHVVLGYPTLEISKEMVVAMVKAGADCVELQIPFSDPMADGPVIRSANQVAVSQHITLEQCFDATRELTATVKAPIYLMLYFHSIFRYGVEAFCRQAAQLGVTGFIIPDLPIEEDVSEGVATTCLRYNLELVRVVSPGSDMSRLKLICTEATGFIYCTARAGTTGSQTLISPELAQLTTALRTLTKNPIAVGFGIKNRADVQAVHAIADMAVIGTALLDAFDEGGIAAQVKLIHQILMKR